MRRRLNPLLGLGIALLFLCVHCSAASPESMNPTLSILPPPTDGPYVITAIDNHFHDAHPTWPIGPGRSLIFRDEGLNLHNVTIVGTSYSRDLALGQELVIPNISSLLGGPGEYVFYCTYHIDQGMAGIIVVSR